MRLKITLISLIILSGIIYVSFLLFYNFQHCDRTYDAYIDSVTVHMVIKEQNADSLLRFTFYKDEKNKGISLLVHNNYSSNVVSFVFVDGIDTLYIRKNREFKELFSPNEKRIFSVVPKDFVVDNPIIGKLPSKCNEISFSDYRFFLYDANKCTYIPKYKVHVITLFHDTERTDSYTLSDMTKNDTINIKLRRIVN